MRILKEYLLCCLVLTCCLRSLAQDELKVSGNMVVDNNLTVEKLLKVKSITVEDENDKKYTLLVQNGKLVIDGSESDIKTMEFEQPLLLNGNMWIKSSGDGTEPVSISVGSTEVMSIDPSNHRIGVGTDEPASALHIVGDAIIDGSVIADAVLNTNNTVLGVGSTAIGGTGNDIAGENNHIGGGADNTVTAARSTIGGGKNNIIEPHADLPATEVVDAFIGGGEKNVVNASFAVVAGGFQNIVEAQQGVVMGGQNNMIDSNGTNGVVPGGKDNLVNGTCSLAAGQGAQAIDNNCFVWSDGGIDEAFASGDSGEFAVRARGGIRLVTGEAGVSLNGSPVPTVEYVYLPETDGGFPMGAYGTAVE